MPTTKEMFSDVENDAAARASRLESLQKAIGASIERHDKKIDSFTPKLGIIKGGGSGPSDRADRLMRLAERFAESQGDNSLSKSLSPDQASAVAEELAALTDIANDLRKDITVASPGNLHPYDLEAPAKVLVPRFTPLRNMLSRQKGQGISQNLGLHQHRDGRRFRPDSFLQLGI